MHTAQVVNSQNPRAALSMELAGVKDTSHEKFSENTTRNYEINFQRAKTSSSAAVAFAAVSFKTATGFSAGAT